AAPLGPHQAGKTAEQKAHQLGAEVAAVTVELLVAAHGQLLQLVDQVAAVSARLRQCQVLAQAAVVGGETAAALAVQLVALQRLELLGECLPVALVQALEQTLLHGAFPSRPRAIALICASACSAGTCSGSASKAASSWRRPGDSSAPRSA